MPASSAILAAIALMAFAANSNGAVVYVFEDLHDSAYVQSFASGGDSDPVGFFHNVALATDEQAAVWNGPGNTYTTLHPALGFDWTRAQTAFGSRQFGFGRGVATGGREHALQWTGSADSVVDLHPVQFTVSRITYARDTQQVGIASMDPGGFVQGNRVNNRALLWNDGTGVTSLHPPGTTYSEAFAVYNNVQVGVVEEKAALWRGTAGSYVNLQLPGTWFSEAHGIFEDMQVGYANVGPEIVGSFSHAMIWFGSADSAIDIHPAGFTRSRAFAASAAGIAGAASGTNPFDLHACAWLGPTREFVDLSITLGPDYTESWAVGLNDAGNIFGYARYIPSGKIHAIEWSPVPEPHSTLFLGMAGIAMLARRSRGRRWPPCRKSRKSLRHLGT